MKGKILLAGILVASLFGQNAWAKSLEDVLKEKEVITEEEYKEVTKSSPISYQLGKGFTFKTPDNKFSLSLGARLQARYTYFYKDDVNAPVEDVSEWRIRRMKMFMTGHAYTPNLTYKLQVNFVDGGSSKLLEDAFLNYKFVNEAQILGGQDKVPFARQELTSSGAQQFVDRSNATDTFKVGRDTGVMFHGKAFDSFVTYNLGWYGGVGQSTLRTSTDNAYAARICLNPLGDMPYSESDLDRSEKPLVSIGGNYYRDTLKATRTGTTTTLETNNLSFASSSGWLGRSSNLNLFTTTEKVDIDTFGADVAFKWMGFSAQGEYFFGQANGRDTETEIKAEGFYAQAGYLLIPKHLEIAARYSYVDPNQDVEEDLQTEIQGAVSYYFYKHNLKIQADVSRITKENGAGRSDTEDMQYRLQAQIIF
jgi:phosphate-selective porin OprO/OprP